MSTRSPLILFVALASLSTGACVTWQSNLDKKQQELTASERQGQELRAQITKLQARIKDLEAQVTSRTGERDGLRKQLDDAQALIGDLQGRLEKLGQKSQSDSVALRDAEKRLEELRKQAAAAEARAATFRTLVEKLRSMIDNGQLKVTVRRGRMLIVLPNDVLFDSGRTDLKQAGKDAIGQVAQVLAGIGDRRFLVAGHTDNVPIKTARFPSNWELSAARAIEVTRLLIGGGMRPEVLGAAGYAEFDPVVPNDTPEQRGQNRRIEIVLEPNLSDLPSLDNLLSDKK